MLGVPGGDLSPRVSEIAAILTAGGMDVATSERIRDTIWSKLLLNLGSGLLGVLTGTTPSVFFAEEGCREVTRSVLAEGAAIAAAMGCHVQPDADGQIRNGSASHHKTSILQDFELGRPMEIDSLYTVPLEMRVRTVWPRRRSTCWWPWSAAGRAGQDCTTARPSAQTCRLHTQPDRFTPRLYRPAMTFFESLLVLLLVAVVLLQLSRRVALPYPALLAVAGVAVAFIPGAPAIRMDPDTALALFIAPVLLDAAYDFPVSVAGALWRPMLVLAAGVTLATAAAVALRIAGFAARRDFPGPDPREVLRQFPMLAPLSDRLGDAMSGGQQQMLAIARAIAARPRLLLLDEPTEGLAPVIVEQLAASVEALCAASGVGLLLCEQHRWFAQRCTDYVYVMASGRVVWEGDWPAFRRDTATVQSYLAV